MTPALIVTSPIFALELMKSGVNVIFATAPFVMCSRAAATLRPTSLADALMFKVFASVRSVEPTVTVPLNAPELKYALPFLWIFHPV